ncbi:hypothetical protein [Streptomyces sp. NPDC053048]|uniref:hypothetical protein n=1 Tax=Streptomyces sp. NPDC053048 TaxID=3365694 RepID=UPI0037CE1EAA
MFGRRGLGVVLSSLALLGTSVLTAPAAQAHDGPIGCTGQASTTYSPGLTLTPRPIGVSEDIVYRCADAPGHLTAARSHIVGESPDGTCVAFHNISAREVVTFGDGTTSEIEYPTGRATRVLGVNTVRLEGIVVSGRGEGGHAERVMQVTPSGTPADCLTSGGITASTGQVRLTILP